MIETATGPRAAGAAAPAPPPWRRLHPLTPFASGWKVAAVVYVAIVQDDIRRADARQVLVLTAVAALAALGYGWLAWRFTRYRLVPGEDGGRLAVERGVLFRRSRTVPLARLQAVDVRRPLVARLLGLAELRLEVAGGGPTEAPLAFLAIADAHRLRAELLARSAGLALGTAPAPDAEERLVARVPFTVLVGSMLFDAPILFGAATAVLVATGVVVTGSVAAFGFAVPALLGAARSAWNAVVRDYGFTVALAADGLRVRSGLLETRARTVAPGRVQAVEVAQPLLWRGPGWLRVRVTVAGYAGSGEDAGRASLLLPAAPRDVAVRVAELALPGVALGAVPLVPAPPRARWRAPLVASRLAAGDDERAVALRDGVLRRRLVVVPHARVQSLRLRQGPWQRRLGLASVTVDLPPGPVTAVARHRDAGDARALLERLARRSREARLGDRSERWAEPPAARASLPAMARPAYDPWSPSFVADPYPAYAELRDRVPVQWFEPTQQWLVARYADVNALLRDRRLGRTYLHVATHEEMGHPPDLPGSEEFWKVVRDGMLDREPPDHTRLRRLVSAAFTPRMVARLQPRVAHLVDSLVDDLLDATAAGSSADLMATVAEPLPVTVIAEMLGVPEPDRHLLRPWSADICGMYELNPAEDTARVASRAAREFGDYLRGLARERRAAPRDDLISALSQVVDEGDRLTEDELVGTCVLLLNAGHEASVNVAGNGWRALFLHPGELARLRADRALLPAAIEELLRFDTPLQMFERWVLQDIEVQGRPIRRGQEVALLFGSANRDPARFADPDRLDLGRRDNPHLSFGAGIHFCLGAPLARMELATLFGALLDRVPTLALAGEPEWKPGYVIRGLESLPVTR